MAVEAVVVEAVVVVVEAVVVEAVEVVEAAAVEAAAVEAAAVEAAAVEVAAVEAVVVVADLRQWQHRLPARGAAVATPTGHRMFEQNAQRTNFNRPSVIEPTNLVARLP